MSSTVVSVRSPGCWRRRLVVPSAALLVLVPPAAASGQGPGDPTTVMATGLGRPCRGAFDDRGDLFIAEIVAKEIRRITPAGTVTLFNSGLADYRGLAFDAFGDLLLSDATDDVIHRISPQGVVTTFASVQDPNGRATLAPDGDVWIPAGASLHRFTPLGALVESIDIGSQGASGVDVSFAPSGQMMLANWGNVWELEGGVVTPIQTGMPLRNWGVAFDADGNVVRAREAMEAGDTDRIILWSAAATVLHDSLVTQVEKPCAVLFARDATGATTNQLVIAQTDGVILRANPAGFPSPGHPVTPISINGISPDAQVRVLAGQSAALTANEVHFLDAIGNRNTSFDVGDFRAFLIATGAVASPIPGLVGAPALAALAGIGH